MGSLNSDQISVLYNVNTAPAIGEGSTAIGGPIAVLNGDSYTLTANDDDPYDWINNAGAEYDQIYPLVIPNMGVHLEMYHITQTAVTVTPIVRVFGLCPAPVGGAIEPSTGKGGRLWPQDIDSVNFADVSSEGFWIPLTPGGLFTATTASPLIDFDVEDALLSAALAPDLILSARKTVYLAGVTKVMVGINTAATVAGVGMIVGRVTG